MPQLHSGLMGGIRYQISNSVRLRASASAYFSRTFGAPTDNKKWTISMWVKRGKLSTSMTLFGSGDGTANNYFDFTYQAADTVFVQDRVGAVNKLATNPSATLNERDPTGHTHVVFTFDSNNATVANRNLLYFNNQNFPLAANLASGDASSWNVSGYTHVIGASDSSPGIYNYWDGLISEVVFVDGQALAPSSFGTTDSNGVWVPKAYAGTYGNNGFHLDFKDANLTAGSNVGLGKDVSGNGNYWNTNNISVTAGVTYDSMVDTPTNNYATLSPIDVWTTFNGTLTAANLDVNSTSTLHTVRRSTQTIPSSGRWYGEVNSQTTTTAAPLLIAFGLCLTTGGVGGYGTTGSWAVKNIDVKTLWNETTSSGSFGGAFTSGTYMRWAYDTATRYLWIGDQSNWYNSTGGTTGDPAAGTNPTFTCSAGDLFFFMDVYGASVTASANFGQRPTATAPTGFKGLCTANLPAVAIPQPSKHHDVKTHAGSASTQSITGVGFQPDLVWVKDRGNAQDHKLTDSVRGTTKALISDTTGAETTDANGVTAFNSNGFSLGTGTRSYSDSNTDAYVDWLWKAGGNSNTFNKDGVGYASMAAAGLTDGSIAATGISVNTVAGFSIVTYTGTGANATVGHGLGKAPGLVIVKSRQAANWPVYYGDASAYMLLNTVGAQAGDATCWNNTHPTTTTFSVGTLNQVNFNAGTYVAYCFAEIPGYSKFGSYTGNGAADGTNVICGFSPRYVLIKSSTAVDDWRIYDSMRPGYNVIGGTLLADTAGAETTSAEIDFTANGFKLRVATTPNAAQTYIYAAFAAYPFGGSNVSPSPAR